MPMLNVIIFLSFEIAPFFYLRDRPRPSFWDFWPPVRRQSASLRWEHIARRSKCLPTCSPAKQRNGTKCIYKLHYNKEAQVNGCMLCIYKNYQWSKLVSFNDPKTYYKECRYLILVGWHFLDYILWSLWKFKS